jgi:hypothetical protein
MSSTGLIGQSYIRDGSVEDPPATQELIFLVASFILVDHLALAKFVL